MAKSRNFSIYLLKAGYDSTNALKEDHALGQPLSNVDNLPDKASLYLSDNAPSNPWWKSYWGINRDLQQVLKGAFIFIPIDDRCVALTFGHTYHNLKNEAYEYDFGLRATLNAIEPDKIRSTDIVQPEDAKRERIQSPIASDLTYFDINTDESIVKRLTGAVRPELKPYFQNVTGANNIRISSKVEVADIVEMCSKLIEIYERDDFKTAFPDLQNITPTKDPTTLRKLNAYLLEAFQARSLDLVLVIPEIIDHDTSFQIAYTGAHGPRKTYNEVFIDDYREFLTDRRIAKPTLADLQHHQMNVRDDNNTTILSYPIYQSLLFDCDVDGNHYHLCDGSWYRIERSYIQKLKTVVDPYFFEHSVLKKCEDWREDDYNRSVADNNAAYICLDKTNIAPEGQRQVEPCDIFTVENGVTNLIHIKISTRSAALSHLFNQGVNSVELLRLHSEAKEKLKSLVLPEQRSPIDDNRFAVTYGIVTAKDKLQKSDALPIFSRISLRRVTQALKLMAIDCKIVLIEDKVDRKAVSPGNETKANKAT